MFGSPKRSALVSWLLHGGAILLILATTRVKPQTLAHLREILIAPADLADYKPSPRAGGGGGGGAHAATAASIGNLPRFARRQFAVPRAEILNPDPILPMEPTLLGDPGIQPASFDYARYGDPRGVAGPPSDGRGTGGGIGDGAGTGVGPGRGVGHGPGDDYGEGGGTVGFLGSGTHITEPSLLLKIDPEYSEEARKARLQGTVLLRIEVDTNGRARNILVTQGLGLGLDDRAVEAVRKWKFVPGKVNGNPAVVTAYVEVNFRLL